MHVELLKNLDNHCPKIIAAYRAPTETVEMFYQNLKEMFPNVADYILKTSSNTGKFMISYSEIKQINQEYTLCNTFTSMDIDSKLQ